MVTLTPTGLNNCKLFIKECEAYRKELLDARKDTAGMTELPTLEGIISDIEEWYDDELKCYGNGWGVTDNYDLTLFLDCPNDFTIKGEN